MSEIKLADIRTDYRKATLQKRDVARNPLDQFNKWLDEVLHSRIEESNAMTLATTTKDGMPSARIVLLKGIDEKGFYFYTNYKSRKGKELSANPRVALVFFWKELQRQVRIEGTARKTSAVQSDAYFHSRPEGSQIGAWASPQSQVVKNREFLEDNVREIEERFRNKIPERPYFWGGFCVEPHYIEFWQGRHSRLHDRIAYSLDDSASWEIKRLAP